MVRGGKRKNVPKVGYHEPPCPSSPRGGLGAAPISPMLLFLFCNKTEKETVIEALPTRWRDE